MSFIDQSGFALAGGAGAETIFQERLAPPMNSSTILDMPLAETMTQRRIYKYVTGIVSNAADWGWMLELTFWRGGSPFYRLQTGQGLSQAAGSVIQRSIPVLCVGDWDPVVHAANDVKLVIAGPNAAAGEQAVATLRPLYLNLACDRVTAGFLWAINVTSIVRACLMVVSDQPTVGGKNG